MRYLITIPDLEPFLTNWYSFENNYVSGMVIYDLYNSTYSTDGETFTPLKEDSL